MTPEITDEKKRDCFDARFPTVTEIRERYGNHFVDLNDYKNMTLRDMADAVLNHKPDYGLIVPEMDFWNRSGSWAGRGESILYSTPLRFKKFGNEVNIIKSNTTMKEIKERKLTPRKAFMETLSDPEVRKSLSEEAYRGIGWWSPGTKTHNIMPFDALVEGYMINKFLGDDIAVVYQLADLYVTIPSIGGDMPHKFNLRVLPVTEKNDEFYVEWLKMYAECNCEDAVYKEIATKSTNNETVRTIFKYRNPEHVFCRHVCAAIYKAEEESAEKKVKVLVKFPEPKKPAEKLNPWYTLKTRTIVGTKEKARRPLKTEINISLGNVIGLAGPEAMYDLNE